MNTDFANLSDDQDAYDAKTWRIFYVLVVMLFVTAVTAWGIVS